MNRSPRELVRMKSYVITIVMLIGIIFPAYAQPDKKTNMSETGIAAKELRCEYSINPLGIAMPGDETGDFVLDIAFGATAHGKIRVYAQKKEAIPEGWAFDAQGKPTRDALAALDGLIQPIGGHKGVGLGMAVGMLSSLLSGAGYGTESGNMVDGAFAGRDGHFVMALNIAAFTDPGTFRKRVGQVLSQIRQSARAPGIERLFTPGEIEAGFEADYRHAGNDKCVLEMNPELESRKRQFVVAPRDGPGYPVDGEIRKVLWAFDRSDDHVEEGKQKDVCDVKKQ